MMRLVLEGSNLIVHGGPPGRIDGHAGDDPIVEGLEAEARPIDAARWCVPLPLAWFDRERSALGRIRVTEDGVAHEFDPPAESAEPRLADEPPDGTMLGVVDYFDGRILRGWLRAGLSGPALDVALLVDGVARVVRPADEPRADLRRSGAGDGRCGFVLTLPSDDVSPYGSVVCVRAGQCAFVLKNGLIRTDRRGLAGFALAKLETRLKRIDALLESMR